MWHLLNITCTTIQKSQFFQQSIHKICKFYSHSTRLTHFLVPCLFQALNDIQLLLILMSSGNSPTSYLRAEERHSNFSPQSNPVLLGFLVIHHNPFFFAALGSFLGFFLLNSSNLLLQAQKLQPRGSLALCFQRHCLLQKISNFTLSTLLLEVETLSISTLIPRFKYFLYPLLTKSNLNFSFSPNSLPPHFFRLRF